MPILYCIPGMGVDERIFSELVPRLQWTGEIQYLCHLQPAHPHENIRDYVARLRATLPEHWDEKPTILGMSLGGMIASELAQIIDYKQLILISTIKQASETPNLFKVLRRIPLHRLLPNGFSKKFGPVGARLFSNFDKKYLDAYFDMLRASTNEHLGWGRQAAIYWNAPEQPLPNTIHIHGTHDHIFGYKKIQHPITIQQGSHNLIMERAEEVAAILNPILL